MDHWIPDRKAIVSDLIAGLLVVVIVGVAAWLLHHWGELEEVFLGLRLTELAAVVSIFIATAVTTQSLQVIRSANRASPSAAPTWLGHLREQHRRSIAEDHGSRLTYPMNHTLQWNLEGPSATYVDFAFRFINTSVYTLIVPDDVRGHVVFGDTHYDPRAIEVKKGQEYAPGRLVVLVLRLWLTPDQADEVRAKAKDSMIQFNFNILEIWVRPKEDTDTGPFRYFLPHDFENSS